MMSERFLELRKVYGTRSRAKAWGSAKSHITMVASVLCDLCSRSTYTVVVTRKWFESSTLECHLISRVAFDVVMVHGVSPTVS